MKGSVTTSSNSRSFDNVLVRLSCTSERFADDASVMSLLLWITDVVKALAESNSDPRDVLPIITTVESFLPMLANHAAVRDTIRESLVKMVSLARDGKFKNATEEYMRITIGNQPWVIGVGNCFIQERSGHDKIKEASHVMNDLQFRDFMHSLKRLLSKAEQLSQSTKNR